MRKLMCFCDRCAVPADWTLKPHRRNIRFFDLKVCCHGETERFLLAATELEYPRDKATGRELTTPLYVIAFEGEKAASGVRLIPAVPKSITQRIDNFISRLMGGYSAD